MNILSAIGLIVAGLGHLAPAIGVLGAEALFKLYGTRFEQPDTVLLMQHRAILFAILGGLLISSAFVPQLRTFAVLAGLISIVSFLILAGSPSGRSDAIARVVYADWVALAALLPATIQLVLAGLIDSG